MYILEGAGEAVYLENTIEFLKKLHAPSGQALWPLFDHDGEVPRTLAALEVWLEKNEAALNATTDEDLLRFLRAEPPEPAIPALLRIFRFSLSSAVREECFEPAFLDLQNELTRSRALQSNGKAARAMVYLAFGTRAARIIAECVARDWFCLSWRQVVWLLVALLTGRGFARWLLGI